MNEDEPACCCEIGALVSLIIFILIQILKE